MRRLMFLVMIVVLALGAPAFAQMMDEPQVNVVDQVSLDGKVTIDSAYSEGPGFVVIHIDNGSGAPGPVIGFRWLNPGWNNNIKVAIDTTMATPTLFAMLHVDTGEVGTYEFGTVQGADGPVVKDGAPITPAFNVDLIRAYDQFVEMEHVTIGTVIAQQDGWLVIHSDNEGRPGPVLGQTQVTAGVNTDVVVELAADGRTNVLWPMLHVDTGEAGVYEFGTVEGADSPVRVNDVVAVTPIWTVPHVRVAPQIVTHGDGMEMMEGMAPTIVAESVLSEGPGFLVIHQGVDGKPGPVAGYAPVNAGTNLNVTIELDPAMLTPNLWPMLHVDTGEVGTYEFGTVEGADGPVRVNDQVLTFGVAAAPSMVLVDQAMSEAMMGHGPHIYVDQALMDAPGWLAIHSSVDGKPGPVLAAVPLLRGLNSRILVELDPAEAGSQVFPMLHYDTGEAGVYEFGTVEGADGPVAVGGAVVVGPLNITG